MSHVISLWEDKLQKLEHVAAVTRDYSVNPLLGTDRIHFLRDFVHSQIFFTTTFPIDLESYPRPRFLPQITALCPLSRVLWLSSTMSRFVLYLVMFFPDCVSAFSAICCHNDEIFAKIVRISSESIVDY
jgi:hypothetical protein